MNPREHLFGEVRSILDRGNADAFDALVRLLEGLDDDAWVTEVLEPYVLGAVRAREWDRWVVCPDIVRSEAWGTPRACLVARVTDGLSLSMLASGTPLTSRVLDAPSSLALRELRWSDTYVWADDVARLAASVHARSLESLELAHDAMDAASFSALAEAAGCFSSLEFLDVDNSSLGAEDARALLAANWPNLSGLDLSRNPCGDDALELLAELGWGERLTRLDARHMGVTPRGVAELMRARFPHLTRLELSSAVLDDAAVDALVDADLDALTYIGLDGVDLGGRLPRLAQAPWWPRLKTASFAFDGLSAQDVYGVFATTSRALEYLGLSNNPLGPRGVASVAAQLDGAPVRWAYLQRTDAGDEGARAVGALEWDALETLYMWDCGLGEEGAKHLALASWRPTEVDFGNNGMGPKGAREIARARWLDGLEILRIPRNAFGRAALGLARSDRLGSLRTLDLAENDLDASVCRALGANTALSGLRVLRLEQNRFGNTGTAALLEGGALTGLESLFLWECNLSDEAARSLAARAPWRDLRVLNLNRNRIGAEGVSALAQAPWAASLEELCLYSIDFAHQMGAEGALALAASEQLGNLRRLEVGQSGMGRRGLEALVDSPTLTGLRDLDAHRAGLAPGDLVALERAEWPMMWRLLLWGNRMGVEDAEALARCPSLVRLAVLNLNQCQLGPEGVRALLASPWFTSLRALHLNWSRMGEEVMRELLASPALRRFSALNVSENFEGAATADAMANAPGMATTRMLYCSRNAIGDHGAIAFAQGEAMGAMRFLELQGNGIEARGARAIAASEPLKLVETLDLSHNPLGDDGVRAIAASTGLRSLKHLKLNGCSFGDDALRTLLRSRLAARLETLEVRENAWTPDVMLDLTLEARLTPALRESLLSGS